MSQSFFPEITDLASVKEKDIRTVLPAPKECGFTSRQRSSLKFDYDFFFLRCALTVNRRRRTVNQRFLLSTFYACYSMYVTVKVFEIF